MLEAEYAYFQSNREELLARYAGRFVVVRGNRVVGDYGDHHSALAAAAAAFPVGSFLIQECTEGATKAARVHARLRLVNATA